MKGERSGRDTKIYVAIAVFVIIIVFIAVVFSNVSFKPAYIGDEFLVGGWLESPVKRERGEGLLGLEKWSSYTYEIDDVYPASVTVTTIKTIIMMNEDELREKTLEAINNAEEQGILIENDSVVSWRVLKNGHKTTYMLYNGTNTSFDPPEKIKVIGEVWNCGISGTSIIVIGIAQITDYANGKTEVDTSNWEKIVSDKEGTFGISGYKNTDGLIYNIICH